MDALEASFSASLLDPGLEPPRGLAAPAGASVARRFSVYRNNVVAGLVRALESRFPVTARLVGKDFFQAMAQGFVRAHPPRSAILFRYGDVFPRFIEGFAAADGIPYLADVARLELARGRAYHAADARTLPAKAFSALLPEALGSTTLVLHPSAELVTSPHPVVSIWRAHQSDATPTLSGWEAESALVVRPELGVETHLLPPGGLAFLNALSRRATFTRAAELALADDPRFDPVANLGLLIGAGAGIALASVR